MVRGAARTEGERTEKPIPNGVSGAHGVVVRDDLLATLDRGTARKVTVVSAPPGSGKTWLLRAWAARSPRSRRIAFVSVERDQRDPQQFWLSVLRAIHQSLRTEAEAGTDGATPAFDGQAMVDRILFELADQLEPVVLVIDDLHELHSDEALAQLERLLSGLPSSASAVLSARRDPPSVCTSCASTVTSRISAPATCSSARTRPASCCKLPASPYPPTTRPGCTDARKAGPPACAWPPYRWKATPTPSVSSPSSPEPIGPSGST